MVSANVSSDSNYRHVKCDGLRDSVVDEPVEEHLSDSYHGDDLMTPPDVLLELSMAEAEKAADLNVIMQQFNL